MPKFKQNKTKVDPRYFLEEKLEEAVVEPNPSQSARWPGVSPATRVKDLAQRAMRQAAGEEQVPPWEVQPSNDYKNAHNKEEARMHRTNLHEIHKDSKILMRLIQDRDDLPEWCEEKITEAAAGLEDVLEYMTGNKAREKGEL